MNELQTLFHQQQSLINDFFDKIDISQIELLVKNIMQCNGIVYMTGVGKSGIIAQNIIHMFASIGIRSMFLDPMNALHGDLGLLTNNDLLLLFSKSGQSEELVKLIIPAKAKGPILIAIVSDPKSILAQKCHDKVILPLTKELCPFDMAPTTSTVLQLILGNTITAYFMHSTKLTKDNYALNHPAGRIGKRLTLKVSDIMHPFDNLPLCSPSTTLIETLHLMTSKRCGCVLIISELYNLLGIFTDGDLRRTIEKHSLDALTLTMENLMIRNPCTINANELAHSALIEMEDVNHAKGKKRIKEMPVIENDKLVGLLTIHDIINSGL